MQNTQHLNISEMMNFMINANHKIRDNYVKNVSGYHYNVHDVANTYSKFFTKVSADPSEITNIYDFNLNFWSLQQNIWKQLFIDSADEIKPVIEPNEGDKRFSDSEWNKNSYFNYVMQNYLLVARLSKQITDKIDVNNPNKKKIDFYTRQFIDAFSPSNFFFTNPEALRLAFETKGKSLFDGFQNLLKDIENRRITRTDETAFEVGENLALTPGTIIFENELIQLIQYKPATDNTFEVPLVIIPPCINKYYILDLQQNNSFVKFLVGQKTTVYMISWRNPKPGMGNISIDDYIEKGVLKAIEVANHISGCKKVNMLGYCLGGTLLSIACSILSSGKKENPVNSATFIASMIDFSDIGRLGDVIDDALIRKLERGELMQGGVLNGHFMESAFNLISPNDLIWNYVINNYLKGLKPKAFDVIYWTNDNTNLPAEMYTFYMKYMVLENKLSCKNALHIFNTPIDIGKINFPVFVIGLEDDNISPAKTTFSTTQLVSGPVEFILGKSGHVMGVVNPPSKNKYGYYLNGQLGSGFTKWKETAQYCPGSWWPIWSDRLNKLSGAEVSSPLKAGNEIYLSIENAPGRYVKEKC